jgi:DNA-directed RNA polymerase specialized sigma24 family protein
MAMSAEAEALLERAFDALSDDHQEVLSLIHFAELSAEEAGQIMGGREAGAIRSLLHRAKAALSTELERLGFRLD